MKRLTILVDMDGTIAGFNNRIEVAWNELYPDKLAPTIDQLTNWRTDEVYASLHGDDASVIVKRIYQGPEFFNKLEPLPGAIDAIKKMAEEHDVFFCSAPVGVLLILLMR